jgi:hypothetical protein
MERHLHERPGIGPPRGAEVVVPFDANFGVGSGTRSWLITR